MHSNIRFVFHMQLDLFSNVGLCVTGDYLCHGDARRVGLPGLGDVFLCFWHHCELWTHKLSLSSTCIQVLNLLHWERGICHVPLKRLDVIARLIANILFWFPLMDGLCYLSIIVIKSKIKWSIWSVALLILHLLVLSCSGFLPGYLQEHVLLLMRWFGTGQIFLGLWQVLLLHSSHCVKRTF